MESVVIMRRRLELRRGERCYYEKKAGVGRVERCYYEKAEVETWRALL